MKILANRNIKLLFDHIVLSVLTFTVVSAAFSVMTGSRVQNTVFCSLLCPLGMGAAILAFCFCYFKEQNETIEQAARQIREYISGDRSAPVECSHEGELYRLFHEVNSLVSILNAHIENEGRRKQFLKNTISDISHQLKTPLAALNIYNGIIQGEAGQVPAIREFADLSERELDRIEVLVQSLLKMAKFDAGTIVMEKSPVNISELMECVKENFLFRTGKEGKEIILSGGKELMFLCDRNWMTEAVGNMVKNSLDHTEEGGIIRIKWKQSGSMLQITVEDNGRGIPREDVYHIFKRFYRSRYSKDTQGVGLGLPLAKAIIEAHGGTVKVDSEPGIGTLFRMDFLTGFDNE